VSIITFLAHLTRKVYAMTVVYEGLSVHYNF
jgi:hypothetical protein